MPNTKGAPAPDQLTNPLIGRIPGDTMNNCQQVLAIADLAMWDQSCETSDDELMGFHFVLEYVRDALRYEVEHSEERNNVTKLAKEDG